MAAQKAINDEIKLQDAEKIAQQRASQTILAAAQQEAYAQQAVAAKAANDRITQILKAEAEEEKAIQAQRLADTKAFQAAIRATVESEAIQEKTIEAQRVADAKAASEIIKAFNESEVASARARSVAEDAAYRAESAGLAVYLAEVKAATAEIKVAEAEQAAAAKSAAAEIAAAARTATAAEAAKASAFKATAVEMTAAGRTLTTALTLPIVAVALGATKMAYDFQTAVQKVINLSTNFGKSAAVISQEVLAESSKTGVAATELANAYYKVAAAGYKGAQAAQLLDVGAREAATGMGNAVDTTDALIAVVNNYGIANLSAAKAGDIFTATVQNSKFAPAELASSLSRVLPVSAKLAISFQDLGGGLAALSHSTSATADSAVTGLVALSSNLVAATKSTGNASKEMKALGLNAQGLIQDLGTHGLQFTLGEINAALLKQGPALKTTNAQYQEVADSLGQSLDQVKKSFNTINLGSLQKLFPNKKAYLTFLGLTDENNKAAQEAAKNVVTGFGGTLDKAFAGIKSSDAGKINIAFNQLKVGLIELGDKVLPKLAIAISGISKAWTDLDPKTKKTIEGFAKTTAEIGPILLVGGKLLTLFSGLSKLLSASPWIILAEAIAILYVKSETFRNSVNALLAPLKSLADHTTLVKTALVLLVGAFAIAKFSALSGAIAGASTKMLLLRGATAEAATGMGSLAGKAGALGAALILGAPFLEQWGRQLGNWIEPLNKDVAAVQDLNTKNDALIQSFKDTGIPLAYVYDAQKVLYDATNNTSSAMKDAQGNVVTFGAKSQDLVEKLKAQGFTNDMVTQTLKNLGVSSTDAANAVNGMDFSGADSRLNALAAAAIYAANGIIDAQNAANNLAANSNSVANLNLSNAHKGIGPGGDPALANVVATIPHVSPTGAGSSGGSGGSGGTTASKAATAAKAAAKALATATANFKVALTDFTTAIGGSNTVAAVDSAFATLQSAIDTEDKALKKAEPKGLITYLAKQKTAIEKAAQGIELAVSTRSNFLSQADVSATNSTVAGASGILRNLQHTLTNAKEFSADIKKLQAEGLNQTALQQLLAVGPTDAGLQAVANLVAAGQAAITGVGGVNDLQTQVAALGGDLGNSVGKQFKTAGEQAGLGLIDGLASVEPALEAQIKKMAKLMTTTVTKDLKIKSPSQVFFGHGANTVLGMIKGVEAMMPALRTALGGLSATGMAPASRGGAASGGGIHFHEGAIQVTGGDKPRETGKAIADTISDVLLARQLHAALAG